jgi:predicted enzyme related to lactoylglutathione lyase
MPADRSQEGHAPSVETPSARNLFAPPTDLPHAIVTSSSRRRVTFQTMPKVSINIDVDDLEKGVAFYSAAVGLTPVRRLSDFAVELSGAQAPVFLLKKAAATPAFSDATAVRDYARHWTPVHLDFLVEEIQGALDRAMGAGARAESAIEAYPWGRMALLADPFGNGFCLIQLDVAGYGAIAAPFARPEG